jgi:DNA-binding NtrC family response regulator
VSDDPKSLVLVIDDDEPTRNALAELVADDGYAVLASASTAEGEKVIARRLPDIVIADLIFPEGSGLDLVRSARERYPTVDFVILTGHGSIDSAVEAIRLGAADYLEKPVDPGRLQIVLEKIAAKRSMQREITDLRRKLEQLGTFGPLVGKSKPMREIYRMVEKVAPTDATVLITGESGSGKEMVARAIHELSRRRDRAFVAVNCGAIAPTLIESELFGHEKGSFTGAIEKREGYFEVSRQGTLFLDEITEMSPELQTKLLRVLETNVFHRVGGKRDIETDARFISATNRDPMEAVRQGKLREDLYYRLNVFQIHIAPLRERAEDIPLLAQHVLDRLEEKGQKGIYAIETAAMDVLMGYGWPGNVRELKNVISSAYILAENGRIGRDCLPQHFRQAPSAKGDAIELPVSEPLRENEKRLILACLRHTQGDRRQAAEILGVSLKTLYNKLNRYKEATRVGD